MSKSVPLFLCTVCKRYIEYVYEDVRHLPFEMRYEVACPCCKNVNRIRSDHFQSIFGDRLRHELTESPPQEPEEKVPTNRTAVEQEAMEVYEYYQKSGDDLKKTASHFKLSLKAVRDLLHCLPSASVGPGRSGT